MKASVDPEDDGGALRRGDPHRQLPLEKSVFRQRVGRRLSYSKISDNCLRRLELRHAESETEKSRVVQDRLFESDFDRVLKLAGQAGGGSGR